MTNSPPSAALPLDHGGPADREFELFDDSVLEGSIVDRFEAIARRFASRLAVQDTAASLTYGELAALVERIAAATIAATQARAGPVAILLPPNAQFPAAMLGVLAASRAYVPLDADVPIERNGLILSEAGACAVISNGDFIMDARTWLPRDIPVIDIQALPTAAPSNHGVRPGPDDLACIFFTSGSTAKPKGVALSHSGLLQSPQQFTNSAHLCYEDRLLLGHSPSTAAAPRSIYGALLNGASLHILPFRNLRPADFVKEMRVRGITIWYSTATRLRRVTEIMDLNDRLYGVRIVNLGGERVEWSDVDACRRCFSPDVLVCITFASTESSGAYCLCFVDDSWRASAIWPPIGRPTPHRSVTIVDSNGNSVADGEVGEIIVASRFIALGYWRGSDRQVDAFPADPADPKARVFATGDLGRRRPDGLIEFVGRNDQQVKLHGHRIEPAEVESVMMALPVVNDAAVVVRRNEAGMAFTFVAYAVLRPGIRGLLPRHLQALLAQRLPRYLVPSRIYVCGELPRLPNDKIDRRTLARLDADTCGSPPHRSADPLAAEITRIFERTVGVEGATLDDTIASLGGDSLQAVSLVAELERRYAISMPDAFAEQHPTIHQVAHWIALRTVQRTTGPGQNKRSRETTNAEEAVHRSDE